jgi:hypothetical protein
MPQRPLSAVDEGEEGAAAVSDCDWLRLDWRAGAACDELWDIVASRCCFAAESLAVLPALL